MSDAAPVDLKQRLAFYADELVRAKRVVELAQDIVREGERLGKRANNLTERDIARRYRAWATREVRASEKMVESIKFAISRLDGINGGLAAARKEIYGATAATVEGTTKA